MSSTNNRCYNCCRAISARLLRYANEQARKASRPGSHVSAMNVIDLLTVGMRPPSHLDDDVDSLLTTIKHCPNKDAWPCHRPPNTANETPIN